MIDYAFIRLKPTLDEAKNTNLNTFALIGYFDQIQLSTTGTYTQITNLDTEIAFDGNYAVYVCDCLGVELFDITSKVTISEASDNKGKQQIKFTLSNIAKDFNTSPILLKFKHTVSNYVWYSNPFLITDHKLEHTSRFDYRDYKDFNGIAYNVFDSYQSIRLKCVFMGNDIESKVSEYTTIQGLKVSSRLIDTTLEKYKIDSLDNFTYLRLNKLLSHPVIYINDYRLTNKMTIPSTDYLGGTNVMSIDFKVAVNYNEKYSVISQIPKDFDANDFDSNDFLT